MNKLDIIEVTFTITFIATAIGSIVYAMVYDGDETAMRHLLTGISLTFFVGVGWQFLVSGKRL